MSLTFKSFIYEQQEFDLEKFKKDCAPFLKQLAKVPNENIRKPMMFHGTPGAPADWEIRQWKERSGPRDTPPEVHNILNQGLEDLFGAKIRNWMFASPEYSTAKIYARNSYPCAIFPIGNFELYAIADDNNEKFANDLTSLHGMIKYDVERAGVPEEESDVVAARHLAQKFKHMHWVKNDLRKALTSEYKTEIMFKCDKFYMFNFGGDTFHEKVAPFVNSLGTNNADI